MRVTEGEGQGGEGGEGTIRKEKRVRERVFGREGKYGWRKGVGEKGVGGRVFGKRGWEKVFFYFSFSFFSFIEG